MPPQSNRLSVPFTSPSHTWYTVLRLRSQWSDVSLIVYRAPFNSRALPAYSAASHDTLDGMDVRQSIDGASRRRMQRKKSP